MSAKITIIGAGSLAIVTALTEMLKTVNDSGVTDSARDIEISAYNHDIDDAPLKIYEPSDNGRGNWAAIRSSHNRRK